MTLEKIIVHVRNFIAQFELRHEKTSFFACQKKGADQLRWFCNIDSTIPLLPKSSMAVQPELCTWSETLKFSSFLATRLICALVTDNDTVRIFG